MRCLRGQLEASDSDEDNFHEDTEKDIENLDKEHGPIMGSIAGTSASQIDPGVSRAEQNFCEITPFNLKRC